MGLMQNYGVGTMLHATDRGKCQARESRKGEEDFHEYLGQKTNGLVYPKRIIFSDQWAARSRDQ